AARVGGFLGGSQRLRRYARRVRLCRGVRRRTEVPRDEALPCRSDLEQPDPFVSRPARARDAPLVLAMRLRRSCLAVPGSNPRMMEKAAASDADLVFFDLEDACAAGEKERARGLVVTALRSHDFG